ncbi:GNAT family N-acetyltransferase [bacterium]
MSPSLRRWLVSAVPHLRDREKEPPESDEDEFVEPPLPPHENYPFQYKKEVEVRGRKMRFRPIRPDDDDLMIELFSTFSEDTIYHRFFTHIKITPERVKRFTHIDYRSEMALVAVEREDDRRRLLGVSRYALDSDRDNWAEMAVVVGDPWHKSGIGTALLKYLFVVARNEGLEGIYGLVHYDNRPIFKIFERLGHSVKTIDTGTEICYEILLDRPST